MDCDDGGLSMHGTVTIGGATGTLVMVEGGVALQMPDDAGILTDSVKLETINVEGFEGVDPCQSGEVLGEHGFSGVAIEDGSMVVEDALPDSGLGDELTGGGSEMNLGQQYIINAGELPEGMVGIDGSMLSQTYVPVVMDLDHQDLTGVTLTAQIVDNGVMGSQRMIILAPGTNLPNGFRHLEMVQSQECEEVMGELINSGQVDEEEEVKEEEQEEVFEPPLKKIKVEDTEETAPMLVLTMPENCEEVTETTEEVISNAKVTTLNSNSRSPIARATNGSEMMGTDVTQAWFTTKDDKMALHNKGHQWKQGQWTKEEIEILERNIATYCVEHRIEDPAEVIFHFTKEERKDFYRTVAKGLQRPLFSVYRRVIRMYDQKNHIGKYNPDEIIKLKALRAKHGSDWATIGTALGRSASSVKDRCRLMRDTCNSGKWLPEEERLLAQAVYDLSGCTPGESVTKGLSWANVAERVGTRSEKQCRTKWLNYLNWKQLGGTEWTRDDDIMLINKLAMTAAVDETQVDWNELSENWPSSRSPQWLRGKWWTLKRHVPDYQTISLSDLLEVLKKIHYPKTQIKTTLGQGVSKIGKVGLEQFGMLSNMTLIPVSAAGESMAQAVDSLGEEAAASQGLEVYPSYPSVMTSQAQGAFLITQPQTNSAITLSGTNMATDHIIVHTLPLTQDGVIHSPEVLPEGVPVSLAHQSHQVIMSTGEVQSGVSCLAHGQAIAGIQLEDIDHTESDLQHLAQTSQIVASTVPQISQSHLEIQADLSDQGQIMAEDDHVHFESQISGSDLSSDVTQTDLESHVTIAGVSSASRFVQTTSNDFIENMSSLSDPMLPSESVDLIGSGSDTEGDKSQITDDTNT